MEDLSLCKSVFPITMNKSLKKTKVKTKSKFLSFVLFFKNEPNKHNKDRLFQVTNHRVPREILLQSRWLFANISATCVLSVLVAQYHVYQDGHGFSKSAHRA